MADKGDNNNVETRKRGTRKKEGHTSYQVQIPDESAKVMESVAAQLMMKPHDFIIMAAITCSTVNVPEFAEVVLSETQERLSRLSR